MASFRRIGIFQPIVVVTIVIVVGSRPAVFAQSSPPTTYAGEFASDFKYLVNNTADDAIDVVTAPLHIEQASGLVRSPEFYLVLGGVGAIWGGSYALDQTMRSHLRSMSSSDADLLQNVSYGSVSAATGLLYGYGLYENDPTARHDALTAGMGAGIATLLDIGIKAAFGRLRPSQSSSHTDFFHGGKSFVSGDVAPMFALAAGVSEYFHNEWYVAGPVYSLALLDGFGRMGHDAHWFSDVVGAALLGVGTTELLLWMHRRNELDPDSFKIFPEAASNAAAPHAAQSIVPMGIGISFNF
jgi:membrane-associated phospholipid phosphatase